LIRQFSQLLKTSKIVRPLRDKRDAFVDDALQGAPFANSCITIDNFITLLYLISYFLPFGLVLYYITNCNEDTTAQKVI